MVQIVHEIVSTVCDWVTTTITTFREVVETICRWLPWPLNKLCDLVVTIIKIVETVVEWVCEEVIERIFVWVEKSSYMSNTSSGGCAGSSRSLYGSSACCNAGSLVDTHAERCLSAW